MEDLISKSYDNLLKIIRLTMRLEKLTESVGMFSGCQGFETSLIMINEIWDKIREVWNASEFVFGIPTQDVFLFAKSDDDEAVKLVKSKIDELYDNPDFQKKISNKLFMRKADNSMVIVES